MSLPKKTWNRRIPARDGAPKQGKVSFQELTPFAFVDPVRLPPFAFEGRLGSLAAVTPATSLGTQAVEPLGEAALGQELLFKLTQLLIEQIVCLMDQADERVGGSLRRRLFDIGPIGRIGPIRQPCQLANGLRLGMVLPPRGNARWRRKSW